MKKIMKDIKDQKGNAKQTKLNKNENERLMCC